jgi:hypothetical protein
LRHGVGWPPTAISISFFPSGVNLITDELAASVVHTLPCGSTRMACGITYMPWPHDRSTRPLRSIATTGSALSPRCSR